MHRGIPHFSSNDGVLVRGYAGPARLPCITVGATDANSGGAVYRLKYALAVKKYIPSSMVLPQGQNQFTTALRDIVWRFQMENGLNIDGIVGQDTWAKLGEVGAPCTKVTGTGRLAAVADPIVADPEKTAASNTSTDAGKGIMSEPWFWPAVVGGSALAIFAGVALYRRRQPTRLNPKRRR